MGGQRQFEWALAPAFQRVQWVRLIVGEDRTRAEVLGIDRRRPATLAVSIRMATELVRAGAPLTVVTELSDCPVWGWRRDRLSDAVTATGMTS